MATDYLKLAQQRIKRPGDDDRMPRYLVYARNKKGKTRFSATAPNVLIVDPEQGTDEEQKINPDVWKITEWQDLDDIYHYMRGARKSPTTGKRYEWISLDGMTRIHKIAMRFIKGSKLTDDLTKKPEDQSNRVYGKANDLVEDMLHKFHSLRDLGIILTAQERMIEIANMEDLDDDEATPAAYQYVSDLPKGARGSLNQIVDVVGRLYVVRTDVKRRVNGKVVMVPNALQRRLWVAPHDLYDTGYRSQFELPDFIKSPSVPRVNKAIREGVV